MARLESQCDFWHTIGLLLRLSITWLRGCVLEGRRHRADTRGCAWLRVQLGAQLGVHQGGGSSSRLVAGGPSSGGLHVSPRMLLSLCVYTDVVAAVYYC